MKYDFDIEIKRENSGCVKWDFRKEYFGTDKILPMWVADMDFKSPPEVIKALEERIKHGIFGYTIRTERFFESIITWLKKRHSWEIKKDWICFSPGIVPAVNIALMAYTKPGDKIIVQQPVYYPFFSAVKNQKRILVNNPLVLLNGRFYMDYNDLESKIDEKTRMIILCSPHNPGGSVWQEKELARLVTICQKNNILILSDEIHSDLVFKGHKHIPTALIPGAKDITITCISPSKTFNLAGLATSAIVASNKKLYSEFCRTLDKVHVGEGNLFGFTALEAAYNYGETWLNELLDYLEGNIYFLVNFLSKNIPQIKPIIPESTYLVWLDCRDLGFSSGELKDFMIFKAGLGLSDGPIFGEEGEGFQRINIGCPKKTLEKALKNLKIAVDRR